jgi:hypothetical protein
MPDDSIDQELVLSGRAQLPSSNPFLARNRHFSEYATNRAVADLAVSAASYAASRSCSTSVGFISDLKALRLPTARRGQQGFGLG